MIISHEYKYIFVQLPHTGCSAVARELTKFYGGEAIHRKHSYYHDFLKSASSKEKKYFKFSSIRHPMDEAVSVFYKYKTNHEGYDKPKNFIENGGFVTKRMRSRFEFINQRGGDFGKYFTKFHKIPYDNWSRLDHRNFDFVIRFESLSEDFAEVLMKIGLKQVRPLPLYNPTKRDKKDATALFAPEVRKHAFRIFMPFIKDWGYKFPFETDKESPSISSQIMYQVFGALRNIYWRQQKKIQRIYSSLAKIMK
jgi:Sulfotransferase family